MYTVQEAAKAIDLDLNGARVAVQGFGNAGEAAARFIGELGARVLAVSDSLVGCPVCDTECKVPWVGQPAERVASCPNCNWIISSGTYHSRFEHY